MNMKINQYKSGVMLSYTTQIIHILSGIIYTPVMLRLLGQSEYGLYQLVASVVSYLSLLTLGFGAGYVRFYSQKKARGDETGIAMLNGMFFIIFSVFAIICLLCGVIMLINIKTIFGDGLSVGEMNKARLLMALMVFSMAISFMSVVFTNNITVHERFFFQRIIELLRALFNPFLALPLLIMGYGSIGMVLVSTALTVFSFCMNFWYSKKKLKMKFSFRKFDFGLLKEIWIFTFFIFINIIVDQVNWNVDKFLLGRMKGTVSVAVYGVAAQLNALYQTLSTSISSVFVTRINSIVAEKKGDNALTDLFTKVGRIQFIILALVLSGYVLFGHEFIGIWAGEGYDDSYIVGIFLMVPATIPYIQNLGIEIQRAKNKHKTRSVVYLIIAVLHILLSFPLIRIFGAVGAAMGTAISLTAGNVIFMNIYYHKKLGLNVIRFWKEICRFLPALIPAVIIGVLVKNILSLNGVVGLSVNICIYTVTYCLLMWLFGMNKSEKELILSPLRKIRKKLCKK